MQVQPSSVAEVELIGPDDPRFRQAIESLVGGDPDDVLKPALPFSVIVHNHCARPLALLGVRFDMEGPQTRDCSVVHYADTLRFPEKANLAPGALRFVCAEPRYTEMVLRGGSDVDARGPMNLRNLGAAGRIVASLDCAAFDDGQFAGPDSNGAFDRFQREREAEIGLLEEVLEEMLKPDSAIETRLMQASEMPAGRRRDRAADARRMLARHFLNGLIGGGEDELAARVRNHRLRIRLFRAET